MIRRNTWILLVILIVLIGAAFYFNNQKKTSTSPATPSSQLYLFTSQDGKPTDIKIEDTAGHSVEIARDSNGTWVLKAPTVAAASQGQAAAAATQITALSLYGNVQLGLDVVGLDKPTYVMTVTFDNAKTHKVLIGSITPIQTGYYVQVDGGPIKIAEKSGIDSLTHMLTAPPYLATLTPTITPTPVPSDTATAEPPTATPTSETTSVPTGGTVIPTKAIPSSTPTP
jgi:hypothetical protein